MPSPFSRSPMIRKWLWKKTQIEKNTYWSVVGCCVFLIFCVCGRYIGISQTWWIYRRCYAIVEVKEQEICKLIIVLLHNFKRNIRILRSLLPVKTFYFSSNFINEYMLKTESIIFLMDLEYNNHTRVIFESFYNL